MQAGLTAPRKPPEARPLAGCRCWGRAAPSWSGLGPWGCGPRRESWPGSFVEWARCLPLCPIASEPVWSLRNPKQCTSASMNRMEAAPNPRSPSAWVPTRATAASCHALARPEPVGNYASTCLAASVVSFYMQAGISPSARSPVVPPAGWLPRRGMHMAVRGAPKPAGASSQLRRHHVAYSSCGSVLARAAAVAVQRQNVVVLSACSRAHSAVAHGPAEGLARRVGGSMSAGRLWLASTSKAASQPKSASFDPVSSTHPLFS